MSRERTRRVKCATGPRGSTENVPVSRRFRLVPSAITPIEPKDLVDGLFAHAQGRGRDEFRAAIESRLHAESSATYGSFRRALAACLLHLAEGGGDRETILVPAFCSSDFQHAIEGVGLRVDRYDVDRSSLSMDLESVRERMNSNTLALVAVNVLGYTSPMDEVASLCRDRNVPLVEAIGYALGSTYEGRPLGSFGDYAVLNFQEGKPVPVGGGMVVSHRAEEFWDEGRIPLSPNVGSLAGYAAFSRPRLYKLYVEGEAWLRRLDLLEDRITTHPGSKRSPSYEPPFRTMSNFQGAVGLNVLDRLADNQARRARTARFYRDALADCEGIDHLQPVDGLENHQYVRYPLAVTATGRRRELARALREVGIQTSMLYDWQEISAERFPAAATLQGQILTLPTHPYTDEAHRRLAVKTIRNVL